MNKASQTIAQKQNYVTTTSDRIVIVSVIFLMITQIFQYIETQVSKKSLKLLWNTLPNLNKKIICKILSQRKKLFTYPQKRQQNLLTSKRNYVRICRCCFWTFQTNKILNFSGKKDPHEKAKSQLGIGCPFKGSTIINLVLIQKNCYSLPWIENGGT